MRYYKSYWYLYAPEIEERMARKKISQTTKPQDYIDVHGVRVNNLKNVSLQIPRDKLIVITGLSGSGKSSLAFETLYAEGQRRYVESLSVYARQFVSKMSKPEMDYITGIPPAIAIQQRVTNKSPRSTVGTNTEVYDYLRMFFARVGHTFSPISGEEVRRHTIQDVVDFVHSLPIDTPFLVCAPMDVPRGRSLEDHLKILISNGYSRLQRNGETARISDLLEDPKISKMKKSGMHIVIDRLRVDPTKDSAVIRLGGSVETAFFEGRGTCVIIWDGGEQTFSDRFEADGITFEDPTDKLFSFNSSAGACPTCEGYSKVMGIDEDLVVPNKKLSLYEDAVVCWRGPKMSRFRDYFMETTKGDFPIHRAYCDLSEEERELLWNGGNGVFGINDFFHYLEANPHKMHYRIMLARYRGRTTCPTCHGKRLKKEAFYVKVAGKDIGQLVEMPLSDLDRWLQELQLSEEDMRVGARLLEELRRRVSYLTGIGLGYLTLNRVAGTLSGGESQRITLATSLGGGLIGSLYILDEPSIGLHPRDTHLLIGIMRQLTKAGNTVVVVEHDEEIMRAADMIVDMGPKAGSLGGEIVFIGNPIDLPAKRTKSFTVEYLTGRMSIAWPESRRTFDRSITVHGAYKHNLKNIDVTFPLHTMTVVTGVSGSGKSTLVKEVFYSAMERSVDGASMNGIEMDSISGNTADITEVEYMDQSSLTRSTRSNPVTYIGIYDDIRGIYADQPLAKQMGFTQQFFSFNKEGGRCENCKGEGIVTVEMQFMADIEVECEECQGKRFGSDVLEVLFGGKSIYDILDMTVDDAIAFFAAHEQEHPRCKEVIRRLTVLQNVGLGYIKLGQNSSTLSGGENQRVKLASYFVGNSTSPVLFIFDEPTTGLHVHDINVLMQTFDALIDAGHSLVIVEHNLDIIKRADYVIDLGPEGGNGGGNLVFQGTPEGLMGVEESYTGRYLRALRDREQ